MVTHSEEGNESEIRCCVQEPTAQQCLPGIRGAYTRRSNFPQKQAHATLCQHYAHRYDFLVENGNRAVSFPVRPPMPRASFQKLGKQRCKNLASAKVSTGRTNSSALIRRRRSKTEMRAVHARTAVQPVCKDASTGAPL